MCWYLLLFSLPFHLLPFSPSLLLPVFPSLSSTFFPPSPLPLPLSSLSLPPLLTSSSFHTHTHTHTKASPVSAGRTDMPTFSQTAVPTCHRPAVCQHSRAGPGRGDTGPSSPPSVLRGTERASWRACRGHPLHCRPLDLSPYHLPSAPGGGRRRRGGREGRETEGEIKDKV